MKVPVPPRVKRKLGQNFLVDENVLQKIVDFFQPSQNDRVFEIGAGTGALTTRIAPLVERYFACELDESLLPYLQRIEGIEIVHRNVLDIDFAEYAGKRRLRIIGNLPYYISSAVLTRLIEQRDFFLDMTLMFQEEVARRILSPPSQPDYGFLAVMAQYYCKISKGFSISRNSFSPKPEVQSRILRFEFHSQKRLDYPEYSSFVSLSFSQRRKKLRNNLLRSTHIEPVKLDSTFKRLQIPENSRAENLSPEQFEDLILALK